MTRNVDSGENTTYKDAYCIVASAGCIEGADFKLEWLRVMNTARSERIAEGFVDRFDLFGFCKFEVEFDVVACGATVLKGDVAGDGATSKDFNLVGGCGEVV